MNRIRRQVWLLLGLGGVLLAVVSFQLRAPESGNTDTSSASIVTPNEPDTDRQPADSGVIRLSEEPVRLDAKPPSARVNPVIEVPQPRDTSKNRASELRADAPREYRMQDKAEGIPEIKDTPPLRMAEPTPLDAPGTREPAAPDSVIPDPLPLEPPPQRQAWNEFDSPPPPPPDVPTDENTWGMESPEPVFPNDEYGLDAPPPAPAPDMEGDFQPEPTDTFDYGGSGD